MSTSPFESVDPATGDRLARYPLHDAAEIDARLSRAREAFASWRRRPLGERAEPLRRAAEILRRDRDRFASLMTAEMGKPIVEAEAETDKCAWVCDYYAEHAERFLRAVPIDSDASQSLVRHDPLGPVLAIMPWNFPFWQVFRFAAPALMAGNAGLLKHAPSVGGCAEALEAIFAEAGFPPGLFQNLFIDTATTASVIDDPRVSAVTITASERAGRAVAERAGAALKPIVLELGGSDPFIVLADAALDEAAEAGALSRLINSGQSCIAAKRFIVEAPVYEAFRARLQAALAARPVGDPRDRATRVGPLARPDLRDQLADQVERTRAAGATLHTGGERPEGPGCFYPTTLLGDVRPGMAAFDEECFGPVAALTRAHDVADAIRLANDTRYGLGAALWTADTDRGLELAGEIESGHVAINGFVKSDPRLPFGGIKCSGYGRELGPQGILEFVNVKTVWLR